jgi:hypothetical protein
LRKPADVGGTWSGIRRSRWPLEGDGHHRETERYAAGVRRMGNGAAKVAELGMAALPIVRSSLNPHRRGAVTVIQRRIQQRHPAAAVEQQEYEEKRLEPNQPGPEHAGI